MLATEARAVLGMIASYSTAFISRDIPSVPFPLFCDPDTRTSLPSSRTSVGAENDSPLDDGSLHFPRTQKNRTQRRAPANERLQDSTEYPADDPIAGCPLRQRIPNQLQASAQINSSHDRSKGTTQFAVAAIVANSSQVLQDE
jgi:hypothetical protein